MSRASGTAAGPSTVVERLGVGLSAPAEGPDPRVLLGLALRDNPRRAQLLVSRVLGKHIPTDPRLVRAAGLLLGGLVADALARRRARALPVALLHAAVRREPGAAAALLSEALLSGAQLSGALLSGALPSGALPSGALPSGALPSGALPSGALPSGALPSGALPSGALPVPRFGLASGPADAVVLGFAETATALGHCVAEALGGVDYLHSTRRPVRGFAAAGAFAEEHSHHSEHLLLPSDPAMLAAPRPLVLVDDELSTGRTVVNTIAALHRVAPRERYVVATLVDLREDALARLPEGVRVDVVSLSRAALALPDDVAERATALRAELRSAQRSIATAISPDAADGPPVARIALDDLGWPAGLPAGGRHGFTAAHHRALAAALPGLVMRLARAADVREGERTLVLGTEELMALPLRLAEGLASLQQGDTAATQSEQGHPAAIPAPGPGVWFSTTTRSPAFVVDSPGYALTSGITFPSHDDPADGPGMRHAYNVAAGWHHVLVVVDPPAETPALYTGLLAALAPHTRRATVLVTP